MYRCSISIASRLLQWFRAGHRDLPWRKTRDPYRIWLSEIMLQQTRAAAAIPYYEAFLTAFPSVETLAAAEPAQVLARWSGLGYYSRARNLHRAARQIASAGAFPASYEAIRALPGVGDYTAAAIASIAFDLPHAAVDGNVLRVIARITNDDADIAAAGTRKRFQQIAQALLDPSAPGDFNQAMMELGATICLPKSPQCLLCPVIEECAGHVAGRQNELPVKRRAAIQKRHQVTLILARRNGRVLLWQRPPDSTLMPGFWELPRLDQFSKNLELTPQGQFRHTITNNLYTFTVATAEIRRASKPLEWIALHELPTMPLSTVTKKALRFLPMPE